MSGTSRSVEQIDAILHSQKGKTIQRNMIMDLLASTAIESKIHELYSLITPIWGNKVWGEDDTYTLNLKGIDILSHIKVLEAELSQLTQEGEEK